MPETLPPKKLTLIRHANIPAEFDGRYIGRRDVALSAAGQKEAQRLAAHLSQRKSCVDNIWCSPALRARQTATPFARQLNLDCRVCTNLHEVDFGRWEGLTFEQIAGRDPRLVQQWAELEENFTFPDGESQYQFNQRVEQIKNAIYVDDSTHLAIVSHGGIIRALICRLLGWPRSDYLKLAIERGGYATLDIYAEQAVLTGLYNEI